VNEDKRTSVPTGNMEPDIERDDDGRAYWAGDGSRITQADIDRAREDSEDDATILEDVLRRNRLTVLGATGTEIAL